MREISWKNERRQFEDRVESRSTTPAQVMADPAGQVILAKATLQASCQEFQRSPYVMISHVIDGGGSFFRQTELGKIEGLMRRGTTAVTLPNSQAEGRTPGATLLGIAISQERAEEELCEVGGLESLHAAASQLVDDQMTAAVLQALWEDVQIHGLSTAYVDHAIGLILHRMTRMRAPEMVSRTFAPLAPRQLNQVLDLIETHLGDDLSVSVLAQAIDKDMRSFSRAFRASTGKAPYEYLTHRRMEKAKELLAGPKSVMQIAGELNYANPAKFAAAFKRYAACSPSAWRRALQ